MTNAHRIQAAYQTPQTRPARQQELRFHSQNGGVRLLRLRMPDQHFRAVAGPRLDVLQSESDILKELIFLVAGQVRHRCVRTASQVLQIDGKAGHVDGPLALGAPRIEESNDFALWGFMCFVVNIDLIACSLV